ncbi:unnamed protein product [Phyllotreta striolata]|uniref:Uncharacterized protein n=2 Tax=Phyllotreta striolata TaxID=444603 RepID=A0A9N9XT33_PHYSR|nr:unnamed protein product [Phyllotreta striolata]
MIKPHHIERLLKQFDMATQITFEYNLELWRQYDTASPLDGILLAGPERSTSRQLSESSRVSPYPSRCSTPDSEPIRVLLSDILNESAKAKVLVEYYNKFQIFKEEQRNSLINVVAHYFEDKGITMSLAASFAIERDIIEKFPTEKLDYYRTTKRGKIYNKWRNLNSHFKCTMTEIKPKPIKGHKVQRYQEEIGEPEQDAETCISTLKYSHLSSDEFDSVWKACSNFRLQQIKTLETTTAVLDAWPFYRQPSGFRLV